MNTSQLERECLTYTRYLIGRVPSQYVVNRYLDFHQKSDAMSGLGSDNFDHFLVSISARAPFWARMADSYASVFRKGSIVRKKLVVTLALLECVAPSCEVFDNADGRSPLATLASLGWRAARYSFLFGASVVVFTPVRVAMAFSWKPRAEAMLEH
ncbi:MAG: hypothetical protein ABSB14_13340 [Candidatus Sulfotelmatobacter sp.]